MLITRSDQKLEKSTQDVIKGYATQHSWGQWVEEKKTISCAYPTELRLFNKLVTVFNKNGK